MLIKLIVKKIIFVLVFSTNKNHKDKQLNQVYDFVIKQIESLPSIHRFLFYFFTLCFIFVLFLTNNKTSKLLQILMTSKIFVVKKYLQSIQGLVFFYISEQVK